MLVFLRIDWSRISPLLKRRRSHSIRLSSLFTQEEGFDTVVEYLVRYSLDVTQVSDETYSTDASLTRNWVGKINTLAFKEFIFTTLEKEEFEGLEQCYENVTEAYRISVFRFEIARSFTKNHAKLWIKVSKIGLISSLLKNLDNTIRGD